MDASKVPLFDIEYHPHQKSRPLRDYRPVSTRPWTLSLFLAATGICFGLLLAIDLVEKEPTPKTTKRDVSVLENYLGVSKRQDDGTCTEYSTASVWVTVCSTEEGYTCYEGTTTEGVDVTTGSCYTEWVTMTQYITGDLLVLTSQESTAAPTSTVESAQPSATAAIYLQSDFISLTSDSASATVQSYYSTSTASTVLLSLTSQIYSTSTNNLISLTSESSVEAITSTEELSLTSQATDLLSLASQSSTESSEPPPAVSTSVLLSLTSESLLSLASETPQETNELTSSTVYLTLTSAASGALISLTSENPVETTAVVSQGTVLSLTSQSPTETTPEPSSVIASASSAAVLSLTSPSPVETTVIPESSAASGAVLSLTSETQTYSIISSELLTLTAQSTINPAATPIDTGSTETSSEERYTRTPPTTLLTSGPTITNSATGGPSDSTTAASSSTTSRGGFKDPVPNENLVVINLTFQHYYYFLAIYLPKFIAVMMATLWSIIFAGLKVMEPFYQLSGPMGAVADDTLFGNYLTSGVSFTSLRATFRGQWGLLLGGAILVLWSVILSLVSECMIIISLGTCYNSDGTSYRCNPGWAVKKPFLYSVLGLVGLVFILTSILLLVLMRRKRTGVFTDPSSIATMADLLGNPQVMEDLQAIKPSSSPHEVKLFLGQNRYKIGLYDSVTGKETLSTSSQSGGDERWGLIKLDSRLTARALAKKQQADYGALVNPNIATFEESRANYRRRMFDTVFDTVMLLTTLCLFAMVLGYWLDGKSDPFNDFFNRGTFGPQFVLTGLALILSIGWRWTSQEVTVMAPYRSMALAYRTRSGVVAARSILATTARTPWTAFYKGLVLRQYMMTIAATCAILADLLLVAVSGVPFFSGQTYPSLKIATFTSLGILSFMIICQVGVFFHRRTSAGGTRKLPRSPDTLIGVWLYLCHSRLVVKKEGFDDDRESPLNSRGLKAKYDGYQCGFARVPCGADGVPRWVVDDVTTLLSAGVTPTSQSYDKYREHPAFRQGGPLHQQRPQPYEASATPIDNTYNQQPRESPQRPLSLTSFHPLMYQQQQNYPHNIAFFEAQAKSPTQEIPQPKFEEVRPSRHAAAAAPPPAPVQRQKTWRAARTAKRQESNDSSLHESLAQWEYEQEFYNDRRHSEASSEQTRWTNDGRSRYRY